MMTSLTNRVPTNDPTNIVAGVFAVSLCLTNALVWALVAHYTSTAVFWMAAAVVCGRLQVWSRGQK